MKTFFTYIFIFFCLFSFSQPNGGFEDWESEYGGESPIGWQTLNFLSIAGNPISSFKVGGLDKFSGNYSLKIKSVFLNTNPLPAVLDDTMGGVFTGEINVSPAYYKYGFAYSGRPEFLEFWYKYFPVGNDFGTCIVLLTKWNGVKRDTISETDTSVYYNPNYQKVQLKLNYNSDEVSDTAVIFFGSSKDNDFARVGSTIFVDEVAFAGWVGVDELVQNKKNDIRLFPNPAKNKINILVKTKINDATFQIINSSGTIIDSQKLDVLNTEINTEIYPSGIYFYRILDEKKNVIDKGKFTIVK